MKRLFHAFLFTILIFGLFSIQKVNAQHGDAPPLPAGAWKGKVSGNVINETTGEIVKESLDVMLHVWDTEGQERLMLHGKTEADGSFMFEDVDFHQTFVVSMMSTYLDATYYSEPVSIKTGDTSITVEGRVYDTTNDLSTISIEQLHVLFYSEAGKLGVTQFYALSNSGSMTVKDAVTLPRDRTGTLKLHLPDDAENVKFGNDDSGSRYLLLAGAFADTAPIPPGEMISQIILAYNLPYTGKLTYDFVAPVAVKNVSFLVLQDSGITIHGNGLTPAGERSLKDGSKFNIFNTPGLKPGDTIQLTLTGELPGAVLFEPSAQQVTQEKNASLGIGAGVLGLTLLGVGIWWWRRNQEEVEVVEVDTEEIPGDQV